MTRLKVVAVLSLVLMAAACQEPIGPDLGRSTPVATQSTWLVGIVAMSDDATPRLGLRHGDILTYLGGNTQDLGARVGESVRVTGEFDDTGVFLVASYSVEEAKPVEAATSRVP